MKVTIKLVDGDTIVREHASSMGWELVPDPPAFLLTDGDGHALVVVPLRNLQSFEVEDVQSPP